MHPQGIVIDFNISHDGEWVIFGVTEQPGMSIGVDVVAMNHDTYGPIDDFISSFNDHVRMICVGTARFSLIPFML